MIVEQIGPLSVQCDHHRLHANVLPDQELTWTCSAFFVIWLPDDSNTMIVRQHIEQCFAQSFAIGHWLTEFSDLEIE